MPTRNLHPDLVIFNRTDPADPKPASYTTIPNFVFKLMSTRRAPKVPGEPQSSKTVMGTPLVRLPATFKWFTLVLIHRCLRPKKDGGWHYAADFTLEQWEDGYDIPDEAVQDWTNAYSVSGLFTVTKGYRYSKDAPGVPTKFLYNRKATQREWEVFITGLNHVLNPPLGQRMARHGVDDNRRPIAPVFTFAVALAVDQARREAKLQPVNTAYLEQCVKDGLCDVRRHKLQVELSGRPKEFRPLACAREFLAGHGPAT